MRLVQYRRGDGPRQLGVVESGGNTISVVPRFHTTYELAQAAISQSKTLSQVIEVSAGTEKVSYDELIAEGSVLPPASHPDPAHCHVTGTGLTHLGSADARNKMHQKASEAEETLTDSMKMFRMGLEGGKPESGNGVQPEWFYKGDGSALVAPGSPLKMPDFAGDGGEEPEVAGIYLIAGDGTPRRIGFALGNEFSDHVTERKNYLYLAHSKLRDCSIGPELLTGALPQDIRGSSRIIRDSRVIWEKPFLSGEANMSHSIANLEFHHFKYPRFRRPGDLHVHFFGTATLSFADGVKVEPGDIFEIEAAEFGKPLRNPMERDCATAPAVEAL